MKNAHTTARFPTCDFDIISPQYVHVSFIHQTHILALVSGSYGGNGEIQTILLNCD